MSLENSCTSKTNCCVVGCTNYYAKTCGGVSFYCFPSEKRWPGRCEKWVKAVNRRGKDGKLWKPKIHSRICSQHFIGGKKIDDSRNPSFLPSIFPPIYKMGSTNKQQYQGQKYSPFHDLKQNIKPLMTESSFLKPEVVIKEEPIDNDEDPTPSRLDHEFILPCTDSYQPCFSPAIKEVFTVVKTEPMEESQQITSNCRANKRKISETADVARQISSNGRTTKPSSRKAAEKDNVLELTESKPTDEDAATSKTNELSPLRNRPLTMETNKEKSNYVSTSMPMSEQDTATPILSSAKKKNPKKILNGYNLFTKEVRKSILAVNPRRSLGCVTRLIGTEWRNLPLHRKIDYRERAKRENEEIKTQLELLLTMETNSEKSNDVSNSIAVSEQDTATPILSSAKKKKSKEMFTRYILFTKEVRRSILAANPGRSFGDVSRLLGTEWRNLPLHRKIDYRERAKRQNEEVKTQLWRNHPLHRKIDYREQAKRQNKLRNLPRPPKMDYKERAKRIKADVRKAQAQLKLMSEEMPQSPTETSGCFDSSLLETKMIIKEEPIDINENPIPSRLDHEFILPCTDSYQPCSTPVIKEVFTVVKTEPMEEAQ